MSALLAAVNDYVSSRKGMEGVITTSLSGLTVVHTRQPSGLVHDIQRPLICLVLQGGKSVTMGKEVFDFEAGDSLLVTADIPTVSQTTRASPESPYLAFVF